ncbi:MAG: DUF2955 domain-containing protein [Pseudomonadota bacterium]|nr:MAG: DUF2955 domain-containing protein [Pseudomonadota bacterium]
MSTDNTAAITARRKGLWSAAWTRDLRTARIVRFATGVTFAAAVAFAIEWPLSFLVPVLTAVFLAMPLPGPTPQQVLSNIFYVLGAFALGLVFTLLLLPFPLIYVPLLGLSLFHIYYLLNRGGPFMLVLMCILAVLILPMMSQAHDVLASGFTTGFVWSGSLAIALVWLAHAVFPDPSAQRQAPAPHRFPTGYSAPAAEAALKSTIVVLPVATLFIASEWSGQILVMVFIAIFSLSPELAKGQAAGIKSLKSTIAGGLAALVFYHILIVVPEYHFFIALMLLTALLFAVNIFSNKPTAAYYPSAFTALLILVSTSMGEGADFGEKFVMRVIYIAAATIYVVLALIVLERYWPARYPVLETGRCSKQR